MFEQLVEDAQSCHWYAYEVGLFDHVPVDAFSALPTCGVPAIPGAEVFTGAGVGGVGPPNVVVWVVVDVVGGAGGLPAGSPTT
jgi:hypothetical protein